MRYSSDGWVSAAITGTGGQAGAKFGLHVRVGRDDDGRIMITGVYVHGDEITNEMLRSLSIPRIQASLSASDYAEISLGADADEDPDLTVAKLRGRAKLADSTSNEPASGRTRLQRPDGNDPEAFYRLVARAYLEYAAETKAPAKAVAEEARVPTTTGHRWVREARRRGYLPEGRKGHVL